MQGNQKVLEGLNELLSFELAAMDQYFIHAQMYLDWGFNKLYERITSSTMRKAMPPSLSIVC